jgi:hypothetical protein
MTASRQSNGKFDGTLYSKNRRAFPVQELQKHPGEWVAFSTDGTRILDSAADFLTLCDKLQAAGIDTPSVVLSEILKDEVGRE